MKRLARSLVLSSRRRRLASRGDAKPTAAESAFCDGLVALDTVHHTWRFRRGAVAANKPFAVEAAGPLKTLTDNTPSAVASGVATLDVAVKKSQAGYPAGGDEVAAAKPSIEDWAYGNSPEIVPAIFRPLLFRGGTSGVHPSMARRIHVCLKEVR